jgi:predicted nucleotidyltransferase
MNSSNQTYKELSIPYFKEVFEIIDEVMVKHKIPYYLIGASAVALELLKDGIKPSRGTKDIDFAIMISSLNEFDELSNSLIKKGFNKVKAPWTFYSDNYNIVVDILPFGEIEENDTIQFNERYSDLHVLGFKEVLENPEKVQIEEKIVGIPPLPGMIILKLVAWSDRPEERENDLKDILLIIEHYFYFNYDEIVESYNDTFPEEGFDQLIIAAEVLGRKSKVYLYKSESLSNLIFSILEKNLTNESESVIAKEWAIIKNCEIEYSMKILKAFQKGIMNK